MNSASTTIMVVSAGRLQFTLQRAPSSREHGFRTIGIVQKAFHSAVQSFASPPSYRPARMAVADFRPSLVSRIGAGVGWGTMTVSFASIIYVIVALPGLLD